ncbi:MAG TPA: hypothetical protein P5307_21975 [Pirellulaceae bacterium]|nr:hypothetical protein [Pirellulaceae bacterium]
MRLLTIILAFCSVSVVFVALVKWAKTGTGYWPPGVLGMLLALILGLGAVCAVPAFIVALREVTPWLWVFPPL